MNNDGRGTATGVDSREVDSRLNRAASIGGEGGGQVEGDDVRGRRQTNGVDARAVFLGRVRRATLDWMKTRASSKDVAGPRRRCAQQALGGEWPRRN